MAVLVTPGAFTMSALTTELTTELNTDPKGLGYAAISASPDDVAALMNTAPEPIAAAGQEQINRNYTPVGDLLAGIVLSEFAALTQANRDYCQMLFSSPQVKTGDTNLRNQLGAIFGAATTSRANLLAASQKLASRAEALWGDGFRVTGQQVYTAYGRV